MWQSCDFKVDIHWWCVCIQSVYLAKISPWESTSDFVLVLSWIIEYNWISKGLGLLMHKYVLTIVLVCTCESNLFSNYVSAECRTSLFAFSSPCCKDEYHRPSVGYINFCTRVSTMSVWPVIFRSTVYFSLFSFSEYCEKFRCWHHFL